VCFAGQGGFDTFSLAALLSKPPWAADRGPVTGLLKWMTPSFQQGKPYRESESQFELANPGGILVATGSLQCNTASTDTRQPQTSCLLLLRQLIPSGFFAVCHHELPSGQPLAKSQWNPKVVINPVIADLVVVSVAAASSLAGNTSAPFL